MTGARAWNDPGLPPVAFEPDKACADVDPEVFFPTPGGNQHTNTTYEAVKICRRCPHTQACLTWALTTGQDYGIWGATTAAERRTITGRTAA
jgi:WhiB family transcriptional regulator, redox-sensing transcriptional regulator